MIRFVSLIKRKGILFLKKLILFFFKKGQVKLENNRNIIISLGIIGFCILNYFYLIPIQVIKQGSAPHYPLIVITFISFFSIVYFLLAIFKKYNRHTIVQKDKYFGKTAIFRVVITMFLLIIYVNVIEFYGFILVTTIMLIISMILYGSKDYFSIGVISILFTLLVSYVFRILLHSILPGGILEQIIFGW